MLSVVVSFFNNRREARSSATAMRRDGYRLYAATAAFADGSEGWFGMLFESCCFGLRKSDFLALGGYDERFQSRDGGLVNLDFFRRALLRPELQYVVLLGEGTFHQLHGGVATNQLPADARRIAKFSAARGIELWEKQKP